MEMFHEAPVFGHRSHSKPVTPADSSERESSCTPTQGDNRGRT